MGSLPGTFLAAILVAELNAFGILVLPGVSIALAFIVMALVVSGLLTRFWLSPLVGLGYDAVTAILTPIASLFQ